MEEDFEFEQEDRGDLPLKTHIISGSFAGVMEHVALFPVDTIKTHLQANHNFNYKTIVHHLYKEGGLFRFWKGSSVIATGCIPAHACYFSVYEFFKKHSGVDNHGFQFFASALTGACSTFFHDFVITPYDVIKQRMQLSGQNKCLSCAKSVIKTEGMIALYRSLPITMFMNAPYHVSTVVINENMKKIVEPKKRKYKFLSYFFCAAFAGGISSILTCPMDNIKTKLQTQNTISSCEILEAKLLSQTQKETCGSNGCESECKNILSNNSDNNNSKTSSDSIKEIKDKINNNVKNISSEPTNCHIDPNEDMKNIKYRNIKETVISLYQKDGINRGFFRGVIPRMLFNAPSCAISWMSYEFMKHLLSGDYYKNQ